MNKTITDYDEETITIIRDISVHAQEEKDLKMSHESSAMSDIIYKLKTFAESKSSIEDVNHANFLEYLKIYRDDVYLSYFDDLMEILKDLMRQ